MDKHWWELYYALPEEEQYNIDREITEKLEYYSPWIKDKKKEEKRLYKNLTKKKVLQMLERAKTKDERRWEIDKLIDEEMEKRK